MFSIYVFNPWVCGTQNLLSIHVNIYTYARPRSASTTSIFQRLKKQRLINYKASSHVPRVLRRDDIKI